MDMGASFVLPQDVLVFPGSDLSTDLRAQTPMGPDDYVVTRPNAREPSTVVDKNGVIRYKQIGPVTAEALEQKILPLVRELQNS